MIDDNMMAFNNIKEYDPANFHPYMKPRNIGDSRNTFNNAIINLTSKLTSKKVTKDELESNKGFMDARIDFTSAVQEEQKYIIDTINQMSSGPKENIVASLKNISTYSIKTFLANLLFEQKTISEDEYSSILQKSKTITVENTGRVPGGGTTGTGATGGAPGAPSVLEEKPADKEEPKITGGSGNSAGGGTNINLPSIGLNKTGLAPLDALLTPLDAGLGVTSIVLQALQPFMPLGLSLLAISQISKSQQQLNGMYGWGTPFAYNFSYPSWQPLALPYNTGVSPQIQAMMTQLSNQNMRWGLGNFAIPGANLSISS